jgi:hypothetical protein
LALSMKTRRGDMADLAQLPPVLAIQGFAQQQ